MRDVGTPRFAGLFARTPRSEHVVANLERAAVRASEFAVGVRTRRVGTGRQRPERARGAEQHRGFTLDHRAIRRRRNEPGGLEPDIVRLPGAHREVRGVQHARHRRDAFGRRSATIA